MRLVFSPPLPDAPGFLRRAQTALEFREQINAGASADTIKKLVEFLVPYVKEPADRAEATNALYDASEKEFIQLIDVVTGRSSEENPTQAQPMEKQSNTGPAE